MKTKSMAAYIIGVLIVPMLIDAKTTDSNVSEQKQRVKELLKSIETGDSKPVGYINSEKYTQHNLGVEDGLVGFGKVVSQLPKDSAKVNTVRIIADGSYVIAHSEYNFFGPKVGFDVFRFESGKIVEHWDNLSEKTPPNPSGHTQFDGPTEIKDKDKTEANKKFVGKFVSEVLVQQKYNMLATYIEANGYTQHNSQIGDHLSGLQSAIEGLAKQGVKMEYEKIHKVLGEGNLVLTISEGKFGGKPTSYYDLFRVDHGKIVEHWDSIETIPPKDQWKNQNGKFGFPR